MISIEYLQIAQNAARSSGRCQSSPVSTPVELCRKTWKETALLQLASRERESKRYLSPQELKALTRHWPQVPVLPDWLHSSFLGFWFLFCLFCFYLFISDLYSPPLLSISFPLPDSSLPMLTLILTLLAVSYLCHRVPASRCLSWPPLCSRANDAPLGEYIHCSTEKKKNPHREFRHYWHGLTFITVEESQNCIKEVCLQSSYPLILVNGCGCVENFIF